MPDKPLSDKRQAFCREYMKDSNGTQAATRAGYSAKTANEQAARLLTNVSIKQEIGRLQAKIQAKTETTVQSVQSMYQSAYDAAETLNQPSAMVSAVTGIARLYGMDKDNQAAPDLPESVTAEEVEQYRAMARAATKLRLA